MDRMRWSVVLEAVGDRTVTREEVVELADAVAAYGGIASGIGTTAYGAQIVVEAETREGALDRATGAFTQAASRAGLPSWPVTAVGLIAEDDEPVDPE
jgi:hypothetical protein